MNVEHITIADSKVRDLLAEVKDPEIPVLSILDMGIVRSVAGCGRGLKLSSRRPIPVCPAMNTIEFDIKATLSAAALTRSRSKPNCRRLDNRLAQRRGKRKLLAYGIAPPEKSTSSKRALF